MHPVYSLLLRVYHSGSTHNIALFSFHAQEEIFCTSYVTAYYLRRVLGFEGKAYLMGMEGFAHELALEGISSTGPGQDLIEGDPADWAKTKLDPEVGG